MARLSTRQRSRLGVAAVVVLGTLVAVAAIIWPGYEEQRTPVETGSVWALQTGEGTRYARVNTELGELDTVRSVENPSQLVQGSNRLLVFTQGNASFADVNLALPQNLEGPELETLTHTPQGTVSVVSAGQRILYLTESGEVFVADLSDPTAPPTQVKFTGKASDATVAIAADADGLLAAYSATRGSVQLVDLTTGEVVAEDALAQAPEAGALQLTLIDGRWMLLDAQNDKLWTSANSAAVTVKTSAQARLQQPSTSGDAVYIADTTGLFRYRLGDDAWQRELAATEVNGVPAAPITLNGNVYAAWLAEGNSTGTLWSSDQGVTSLSYAGADIGENPLPEFQVSGTRAILNDTRSGWVWRVPNGDLVSSSQSWVGDEFDSQAETPNEEQAEQVIEPKPPVAVDDTFGVRAGSQIALQVLLNDSDPNEDVLTIVPGSLTGLAPEFGTLALAQDNQQVIVTVAGSAAGTASFNYQVTDGTSRDGLTSNVATVTLTVVPQSVNRAPVWCGVDGCLAKWASPEVAPGQTVETEVLAGWVDPDGDPIYLAEARNLTDVGSVTFTPSGTVVYQHPDPNVEADLNVPIELTVSDDRGATAQKQLNIRVTTTPTLTAKSFAVSGVVSQTLTVSPLAHVTGISGSAQLTAVESLDPQRAKATVNSNAATFDVSVSEPGSYLVRYTVRDELSERTGLVRLLMQKAETATFTAAPLTVFVWAQEDTTVDVLSGVTNPTGRVLLVTDAQPDPVANASMSVDVVSQQYLRVNGGSDSGEPGLLGRIQVEIVDSVSAQRAIAQVTVVSMPLVSPSAPIAVDDRITVRAGAQVDIPVLENDAPSPGGQLTIDPRSVTNTDTKSLAFASGRLIRYLAPEKPGTYQLTYGVFTTGYPNLSDTATITVTVLGDEANRRPQPRTLSARVLSGKMVRIPFDSFGIDPDGDAVVLDRILSQPERGTAAISADGNAIEFTSEIGFTGQVSFEYQVRDALGEVGSARVLVGVRDAQGDPRPVVFTDIVQVQAGESNTIVVEPLNNDVDPSGSPLKITDVSPDAPKGSSEYAQLADHIVSVGKRNVVFTAGTVLGTFSFTYTVVNESGDTAIGLIVVRVIREAVTDTPVVSDTILDLETREQFPRGVDVVTGKTSWATGKVADLKLSLWGNPTDVNANGWKVAGALPQTSRIIPFMLTGVGFDGKEVSSFAFLRVPGEDDLRLALRSNLPTLTVNEGDKIEFDMSKLVLAPANTSLRILESGVRASSVRKDSTCSLVSGTVIRYTASKGAPWRDSCTVPIRLTSQNVYTYLTVPISIEADKPQPELRPAAVTVSPGETVTYDLKQMVTWTGGEDWSALRIAVDAGGSDFTTELSGTTLTIRGADRVRPGTQQAATVRVTSHQNVSASTLTMRAGPAPSTLPKGATVTKQCSQGDGTSCDITVIGAAGEVNPLPNTPLVLVSVENPATCANVTFTVGSANTVRASWTDAAVGAQCTANFIVRDAQERQSLGDRMGSVTLDLLGYPQAPSSVTLKTFGDHTVTLAVNPGAASNAYPALSGFVILRGGQEVSQCGPSGQDCTPITGLTNGERVQFEARSVNSVGQSRLNNPTITTWAYRVPTIGSVTATPTYVSGQTSATHGAIEVAITTNDPEVRAFTVTGVSGEVSRTGNRTVVTVTVPVNTPTITVTPLSQFEAPDGGSSSGSAVTVGVNVAGSPVLGSLTLDQVGTTSITANALSINANGSTKPTEVVYVAYAAGGSAVCSVSGSGGSLSATVTNGAKSTTPTISGLTANVRYTVRACASNGFGLAESNTFTAIPFSAPSAPTGYTFSIADGSITGQYLVQVNPSGTPPTGFTAVTSGTNVFGSTLNITVRYCLIDDTSKCSAESTVTPSNSNATIQFRASVNSATTCQIGSPMNAIVDADGVTGTLTAVQAYVGGSWQTLTNPTDAIPVGASAVRGSYSWTTPGTTALTPYRVECAP